MPSIPQKIGEWGRWRIDNDLCAYPKPEACRRPFYPFFVFFCFVIITTSRHPLYLFPFVIIIMFKIYIAPAPAPDPTAVPETVPACIGGGKGMVRWR